MSAEQFARQRAYLPDDDPTISAVLRDIADCLDDLPQSITLRIHSPSYGLTPTERRHAVATALTTLGCPPDAVVSETDVHWVDGPLNISVGIGNIEATRTEMREVAVPLTVDELRHPIVEAAS